MTNEIFTDALRVRSYECDSLGHVNNAVYLQWLQQLTSDAAHAAGLDDVSATWTPRTLAIEYHAPARDGDALALATWMIEPGENSVTRGYKIHRLDGEAQVASARIRWAWRDRTSGQPHPLPSLPTITSTSATSRNGLPVFRSFTAPDDNGSGAFRWRHTVHRYELDGAGQVGIAAWFHWLEEATFRAVSITSN